MSRDIDASKVKVTARPPASTPELERAGRTRARAGALIEALEAGQGTDRQRIVRLERAAAAALRLLLSRHDRDLPE